jgi:hypothetical protein
MACSHEETCFVPRHFRGLLCERAALCVATLHKNRCPLCAGNRSTAVDGRLSSLDAIKRGPVTVWCRVTQRENTPTLVPANQHKTSKQRRLNVRMMERICPHGVPAPNTRVQIRIHQPAEQYFSPDVARLCELGSTTEYCSRQEFERVHSSYQCQG